MHSQQYFLAQTTLFYLVGKSFHQSVFVFSFTNANLSWGSIFSRFESSNWLSITYVFETETTRTKKSHLVVFVSAEHLQTLFFQSPMLLTLAQQLFQIFDWKLEEPIFFFVPISVFDFTFFVDFSFSGEKNFFAQIDCFFDCFTLVVVSNSRSMQKLIFTKKGVWQQSKIKKHSVSETWQQSTPCDVLISLCNLKPPQQNSVFNTHQHVFCCQKNKSNSHTSHQCETPTRIKKISLTLIKVGRNPKKMNVMELGYFISDLLFVESIDLLLLMLFSDRTSNDNLRFESGTYSAFSFLFDPIFNCLESHVSSVDGFECGSSFCWIWLWNYDLTFMPIPCVFFSWFFFFEGNTNSQIACDWTLFFWVNDNKKNTFWHLSKNVIRIVLVCIGHLLEVVSL